MEPKLFRHLLRINDLEVDSMVPKEVRAFHQYIEEASDIDLKLKKLTFRWDSVLDSIEGEILAKTWPRLERIVVHQSSINEFQVASVFQEIVKSVDNKLKYIKLPSEIRDKLPVQLLTETKTKMKVVFSDDEDSEAEVFSDDEDSEAEEE